MHPPRILNFERQEKPVIHIELGPGGSVAGATDEEVQRRAVETNPSRRMVVRECRRCHHTWRQPAFTGACPRCHAEDTRNLTVTLCMAQRLK